MNFSRIEVARFFLRDYVRPLSVLFLLYLLFAVLEGVGVGALYPLLSSLQGGSLQSGAPATGGISKLGVIIGMLPGNDALIQSLVFVIMVQAAKSCVFLGIEWLSNGVSSRMLYDLKKRVIEAFAHSPFSFFVDHKGGDLLYRAFNAPHKPALCTLYGLQGLVEVFRFIGILALLVSVSPSTVVVLAFAGVVFFVINERVGKKVSYNTGSLRTQASSAQNVILSEFLAGIKQIFAYAAPRKWLEDFDVQSSLFARLQNRDAFWSALSKQLFELFAIGGGCGLVLGIALWRREWVVNNLPMLAMLLFAMVRIVPAISNFGRFRLLFLTNLPDAELVYRTLNHDLKRRKDGDLAASPLREGIRFSKVGLSYGDQKAAVQELSFDIPRGKVTALVGASGAGKTTIAHLILKLYEPGDGQVLVDGVDLSRLQSASWLGQIGYVSQDPFIFNASIAENIAFGDPTVTEERILRAAQQAGAAEFIEKLPSGYRSIVGDRGAKLSGGQQQRIAIARALVRDPAILIFDEATSALDTASEAWVQEAIQSVAANRTVLIIAHRLNTVKSADLIHVLKEGRVAESGSYQELMQRSGEFARLHQSGLSVGQPP